jgi:hypothetical protein
MENQNTDNSRIYVSRTGKVYYKSPGGHLAKPYIKKDSPGKKGRPGFSSEAERKAHISFYTIKSNIKNIDVSLLSNKEQQELMMIVLQFGAKLSGVVNSN